MWTDVDILVGAGPGACGRTSAYPLSPYQQTSWTFGQLTADFVPVSRLFGLCVG
jgi:hypothetical protein